MHVSEFIRRVRKWAKQNEKEVEYKPAKGKGSHGTLYVGSRKTTVKGLHKEIGKGLLEKVLKDLGIDKADF